MSNAPARLLEQYNPFVSPNLENPYPMYALARREAPVFFSPVLKMWIISRYDDVCTAYKNHAAFVSKDVLKGHTTPSPEALAILNAGRYHRPRLLIDNDPPDHTRVRGAVNKAFTPARVAWMDPMIRKVANGLIDAFVRDGRADIMTQFAYALPLLVMMDLMGLPHEDAPKIRVWGQAVAAFMWAPLSPEEQCACARTIVEYLHYCEGHVRVRKEAPRDDLLSDLIRLQGDSAVSLTDQETAFMIKDLLFAGHESTTNGIGNMLRVILNQEGQWDALRANPSLVPDAIEEALRVDAPLQNNLRTAAVDVQIGGTTIPAGSQVCLVIGSANHDEAYFPDGERFDLKRQKSEKPILFGHGIHSCPAMALARMELRVALEVLSQRLKGLRLVPEQTLSYAPNLMTRGPKCLEVMWDVDKSMA